METNKIINGDCIEQMKLLPDNSVDAIITDPPYDLTSQRCYKRQFDLEIGTESFKENIKKNTAYGSLNKGFMGKEWDGTGIAFKTEIWKECLRVLKSGGYLLSFGGSRTYHRMASAIEDAGFEIRDQLMYVYGSGFPKSLDIGKQIDKLQGNKRISTGEIKHHAQKGIAIAEERGAIGGGAFGQAKDEEITKGSSDWEGWGSALKPSHEPIVMARKPLSEKNIALNVLKWGTGGINIEESRIPYVGKTDSRTFGGEWKTDKLAKNVYEGGYEGTNQTVSAIGRFPANFIHDGSEEVTSLFPMVEDSEKDETESLQTTLDGNVIEKQLINASRFFYCAKAGREERNKGCEELQQQNSGRWNKAGVWTNETTPTKNNHPTVKPLALMKYLIKLVTPKGGTVLDPFAGSGSTLVACKQIDYKFIGIEKDEEYIKIIEARLQAENQQTKLEEPK